MTERIACATFLVRDYEEALAYFTATLGFKVLEDSQLEGGKRWVVVAPAGSSAMSLLLVRASTPAQEARIGNQTGGPVTFFLHTDDFAGVYEVMRKRGVRFLEKPRAEPYGTVAVFTDLYGNRWDLIESRRGKPTGL